MRKEKFDNVYQFKIILRDTNPSVWRRIQVPENYTFWDLHVAIQDAMGWEDYHLHEFRLKDPITGKEGYIGIPDEEDEFPLSYELLTGWEQKISNWFSMQNKRAYYIYDFGDGWEHDVILEKILPRDKNINYPVCIDGERACPPEDCGSIPGYEDICQGKHEFQEEYKDYHPEHFDPKEVYFDNPKERLRERLDFV
jgi:hypothetical protein